MRQQQLLILHTRAYQESSLLVDALTKEHGRSSFLAKGARRQNKRQWRAALQMGAVVDATYNDRNQLKNLFAVDSVRAAPAYGGEAFACATYLVEVTTTIIQPGEPHPELYQVLEQGFFALLEPDQRKNVLRLFELTIIEALGVAIDFSSDLDGKPILSDACYQLVKNEGFVKTESSTQQNYSGEVLLDIAERNLTDHTTLEVLKVLNRQLLRPYLGNKTLKSRELWRQWRSHTQ